MGISSECAASRHRSCPGYYRMAHPCACGCHTRPVQPSVDPVPSPPGGAVDGPTPPASIRVSDRSGRPAGGLDREPCPCPCHVVVAPGLVPCPECEGGLFSPGYGYAHRALAARVAFEKFAAPGPVHPADTTNADTAGYG